MGKVGSSIDRHNAFTNRVRTVSSPTPPPFDRHAPALSSQCALLVCERHRVRGRLHVQCSRMLCPMVLDQCHYLWEWFFTDGVLSLSIWGFAIVSTYSLVSKDTEYSNERFRQSVAAFSNAVCGNGPRRKQTLSTAMLAYAIICSGRFGVADLVGACACANDRSREHGPKQTDRYLANAGRDLRHLFEPRVRSENEGGCSHHGSTTWLMHRSPVRGSGKE